MLRISSVFIAISIALSGTFAFAEETRNRELLGLDLGYGFTTVRGDDSNFRLDGDLEGFDADLLINPVKDISIGIGGRLDTGSFVGTTGFVTDYERYLLDVNIYYNLAIPQTNVQISPLVGLTYIYADNSYLENGGSHDTSQEAYKANIGIALTHDVSNFFYRLESAYVYTLDEVQKVQTPHFSLTQDSDGDDSFYVKANFGYKFSEKFVIGVKPELRYDVFTYSPTSRQAEQIEFSLTGYLGFRF
jgi:hypothetical protein